MHMYKDKAISKAMVRRYLARKHRYGGPHFPEKYLQMVDPLFLDPSSQYVSI